MDSYNWVKSRISYLWLIILLLLIASIKYWSCYVVVNVDNRLDIIVDLLRPVPSFNGYAENW